jgi:cytochrome c-type biogenesis protein
VLGGAFILAAQRKDLGSVAAVMPVFGAGTILPMLAVALLPRAALLRWRQPMLAVGRVGKLARSLRALLVGGMILTGADRSVETSS